MEITVDQFTSRFAALARQFPSSSDLASVLRSMRIEHIAAGSQIIEYDGQCSTLYLVWAGKLSASIDDDAGHIALGEIGPGEWIGEVSLIEPGPATASIYSKEESTLLSMSHKAFNSLRAEHPAAAGALMHALSLNLAERLRTYGSRAAHQISTGNYVMEEMPPDQRNAIVKLIARLMGIQGAA